ncbi:hypothetical protein D3OALGA1CA_2856 [Olavius algarvensis associated proteobacterium Delta 3]|nr:hypothetical protein D3OALGA1CA_2856 [Olavius algarvensis associated proteobacterium Delta 3]CAB5163239.1 hypothetical protein D3OALGB2SA_5567 [Olavius algarvensis associated proteobacterium Delta 3]
MQAHGRKFDQRLLTCVANLDPLSVLLKFPPLERVHGITHERVFSCCCLQSGVLPYNLSRPSFLLIYRKPRISWQGKRMGTIGSAHWTKMGEPGKPQPASP